MTETDDILQWERENIPYEVRLQFWKNLYMFMKGSKKDGATENRTETSICQ